jgi:hypothetical protein
MDKLFIRLRDPIPGLDHMNAIDQELFALHYTDTDACSLGLTPLQDFIVYEGEYGKDPPRWFKASKGLKTVRGLLSYYRSKLDDWDNSIRDVECVRRDVQILEAVESVLSAAEERDSRFCLVSNY